MEGRNVGTIKDKSSEKGPTSAKDLTIDLTEGRESPYHWLDWLTNLKLNIWLMRALSYIIKSVILSYKNGNILHESEREMKDGIE